MARRRLATGLLVAAVVAVAVSLLAQRSGVLAGIEQRSVAARFDLRGVVPQDDVALVLVDAASFDDLEKQWPFPRSLHAKAVDVLRAAGARDIVYDVQFTEPTTQREDGALYEALRRAGGGVLATSEFDEEDGSTKVLGGDDNLAAIGARAAAANLPDDRGGVVDHFTRSVGPLRSLAVVAAERVGGPPLPASAFGAGGAWIDFRGPPGTIDAVSFSSLVNGKVDPALLRDRIVVVGASAPSLGDVHVTPTADGPMAGAEIQANAIWTALHGVPLRDASPAVDLALLLAMALVVPLARLRLRVLRAALIGPMLAPAFVVVAQVTFNDGTMLSFAAPLLAIAMGTVAMVVASHLAETAARRRIARDNDILEGRVRVRTVELREAQLEILQRLGRAAEWRDEDTGHHVVRIGALSQRLARAVGFSDWEAEMLGHAAVTHDLGKLAIPDRILHKSGPLDQHEYDMVRAHAAIGASMLAGSSSQVMQLAEAIARTHHERWDGTGYPDGLRGEQIPLAGRICAVCDVFDALVSSRPYKRAWSLDAALAKIRAETGRHFDPGLVTAFAGVAREAYAELYPAAPGGVEAPAEPAAIR